MTDENSFAKKMTGSLSGWESDFHQSPAVPQSAGLNIFHHN